MRWKNLLWVWLFLILLVSGVYATEKIGVSIPPDVSTYTQNDTINNATDDSGGPTYGIYVEYATDPLALTVNATVNSNAANSDGYSYAYGVYSDSRPLSNLVITENGNINANATGTTGADAYGIDYLEVDYGTLSINNAGTISAKATVGNATGERSRVYADAEGIYEAYVEEGSLSFTNSGNVNAVAEAGSAVGKYTFAGAGAYGIDYLEVDYGTLSINNTGTINATATVRDATGEGSWVYADAEGIYEAYVYEGSLSFTNSGNINAVAEAGSAVGNYTYAYAYAYGIDDLEVDYGTLSINNAGTINATAKVGNATGEGSWVSAYAVGVYAEVDEEGAVDSFINKGDIKVNVQAGSAIGNNSQVEADYISGVEIWGPVNNFLNKGQIYVEASAGNALGANSTVYVGSVYGVSFEGGVNNFTNEGTIYVGASAGSASGDNSTVGIEGILGVFADYVNSGSLVNKGLIQISVKGGSGSEISKVAGSVLEEASDTTISNEGTIYVNVNASDAKSVHDIAGIVVSDSSNVTISNPGTIWLSVFGPKPENVRTLRIENSTVTLDKSFSIVFGSPGIDPSTNSTENLSLRPIYVDSESTLNLNNSDLIARIDSRNLKFNTKYYLIENEGTVNGEWGSLVRGYANPEVTVDWAGEDYGENSAVIFGYVPGNRSMISAMGYTASQIIASSMVNMVRLDPTLIPVSYKKGLFFLPLYTRVNANDLGFDANAYGFMLGFEGKLSKDLGATVYGGYSRVNLDYDVRGPKDEDQDLYVVGFSLNYAPKPYFVRFMANYHWADHEYKGLTGANYELEEKADYNSWGIDTELTGGYIFRSRNFFIGPEIGLGYTYYRADDFHTKVSSAPQWNRYYDTEKVDFLKGILGVYLGGSDKAERVKFYGSLRLEQSFGDNDVSVITYLPGLPTYKLEKDISNTTLVGQAGVNFKLGKAWSLDLSARGDFNGDYSAYTAKAMLKFSF